MSKLIYSLIPAAFFALPLLHAPAAAAESEVVDMTAYLCKDVMRMSGQDRDVAIALAHGYVLGKKGTTQYVIKELAQITDGFIEYCLDHPDDNALKSFERIAR